MPCQEDFEAIAPAGSKKGLDEGFEVGEVLRKRVEKYRSLERRALDSVLSSSRALMVDELNSTKLELRCTWRLTEACLRASRM